MQLSMEGFGLGYLAYRRDRRAVSCRLRMIEDDERAYLVARQSPEAAARLFGGRVQSDIRRGEHLDESGFELFS